ncbi:TetR family transcriptional regulator [Streptomyces fuscichromogenes]|uniref:TetR family transcriptional regulator n=1 Tax=Streptomyces fuscichromogenes TaxID=1324013 RepID=A0A917X9M6_9ACTN|nr:TetR family transcriptional regulator [Streptomyces fuscichromogenes]GGM97782.1 TetR family transcriptional regulator [Streptomyces fuscichromogenes]
MTEVSGVTSTRDIARAAVRARLAQVAIELFRREGFDQVTAGEIAQAAGVSRSTFLRYFRNKEEAVLSAFDSNCEAAADALRARPVDEDDWTALRHAVDALTRPYFDNLAESLSLARLIDESTALRAARLEMLSSWHRVLAGILAERSGRPGDMSIGFLVSAAAAMECLNIAVEQWTVADGAVDLSDIVDDAFAALAPGRGSGRRQEFRHDG